MNTQELFQHAKDDMVANGSHAAVMYAEYVGADGIESMALFYFLDFGGKTAVEERYHFFDLGMEFGEKHGKVEFICLTFITEVWISDVKPGEKRAFRCPEDDPNRREGLMAQIVEIQPTPDGKPFLKQSVLRAEVIRPAPGIVDLIPDNEPYTSTQMLYPTYFLSGYIASQLSPEGLKTLRCVIEGR